jgi:hypothetical protein
MSHFVHKEYPRMLHKPDGSTHIVNDDAERAAKLAEGWNLLPGEPPAPVVAPEPEPIVPAPKKRKKVDLVN